MHVIGAYRPLIVLKRATPTGFWIESADRVVLIRWNGLVEWNSGMEYWNGEMLQRAYLIKIIIQLWCLDSVDLWNGNILESKI